MWQFIKMSLIRFLSIACTPDSIQSHSDNPQTHPRHLSDTLQTPQMRHILTKPRKLGENVAVYKNESNWMFINCSHIIPSQTVSTVTQTAHSPQTPHRHPKIGHILTKPRQLGEKEAANKNGSYWMCTNCLPPPDTR